MSQTSQARGRRPVARHGRLSSPHPISQLLKLLAVALAVVLVSTVSVGAYVVSDLATVYAEDAVEIEGQEAVPPDMGEIEGGVNIFIAGTDKCEEGIAGMFGKRCTGPDAQGELNDVNMLVHISDEPRRVTVVSFPRDLMLPIPECTREDGSTTSAMSKQMLNSTFHYGGLNCAVQTVSQLSGQPIQYAATVTWGGVIDITNAVGGVEVCLEEPIRDVEAALDLPAGTSTIAGAEALAFLRVRKAIGDGGDLSRISNQQQYMSSLTRKLMSEEVLTNPATLYKLARTSLDAVTPSQTLTNPLTLVQIALAVKDVPLDEIVFLQYPVYADPDDSNRVVPNYQAADQLWAAIEANQPLQLTGTAGAGVTVTETAPPATEEPATEGGETAAPVEPETPAIALPSTISGTTGAQSTCTKANR